MRLLPIALFALHQTIAFATPIVGDSSLLSTANAFRLESWLDQGPIELSLIYDSGAEGSSAAAFHAKANGQGPTFTIARVSWDNINWMLIGGYSPRAWSSNEGAVATPSDASRTAFLFNLTQNFALAQRLNDDSYGSHYGSTQTLNNGAGPQFGEYDLMFASNLRSGTAFQYSYGNGEGFSGHGRRNALGVNGFTSFLASEVEVFAVAAPSNGQVISGVPEPATLALVGGSLLLIGLRRRG